MFRKRNWETDRKVSGISDEASCRFLGTKLGASTLCAISLLSLATVLSACSGGSDHSGKDGESAAAPVKQEPFDLYFLGSTDKERFIRDHGNDIQKKFPHINVIYYLRSSTTDDSKGTLSIDGALTRGIPIDIIHVAPDQIDPYLVDTKLAYDIDDMIKKYKYDLSIVYPQAIETLRSITGGPLYGLPVNHSIHKLYYNKDLFDKFGVSYPKDGLTWDEVYDLAKKLTRTDGGVQYQGAIIPFDNLTLFNQLSAPLVDRNTSKSLFVSDPKWKKFAENLVRFRQIPGNENQALASFTQNGTAAMLVTTNDLNATWTTNWDIAKAPVFADLPGVGSGIQGNMFALASTSKHKDEVFQVIAFLASKEHMLAMEKAGSLTVLNDPNKKKEFGKEIPWLQRKINMEAMFQDKIAAPFTMTAYDGLARTALNKQLVDLAAGKVSDMNTALRQAAEEADKAIQAQIEKTKK